MVRGREGEVCRADCCARLGLEAADEAAFRLRRRCSNIIEQTALCQLGQARLRMLRVVVGLVWHERWAMAKAPDLTQLKRMADASTASHWLLLALSQTVGFY